MYPRPRRGIRYANGGGTEVVPLNGSHRLTPARMWCFFQECYISDKKYFSSVSH